MKIIIVLFGFILLISCHAKTNTEEYHALPYFGEASFTPRWYDTEKIDEIDFHKIPPFSFVNQDGEIVTEKTFENKIYVVDFFFTTCPGICPIMTNNMAVVQQSFKDNQDVLLLSHSVTPTKDSVQVLKDYAVKNGVISDKWHLVTGDRKEIYELGRKSYFVEENLGDATRTEDDFLHTESFVLIDKKRRIRGIYNGLKKQSVQQLIDDIEHLQKEQ